MRGYVVLCQPSEGASESTPPRPMLKVLARLLADAALVALLMFAAAGTLAWPRGWTLLVVLLVIRVLGALVVSRVHVALLRDRARLPLHPEQPRSDRALLVAVLCTGFLGLPVLAALDVFRWHSLAPPAPLFSSMGLVLFAAGWTLKQWALYANAFATAPLRVQAERAHAVADAGVYRIIRHPFYAADPLILFGQALWLQSSLAAVFAVIPITLMVLRLRAEERFLHRSLPGYGAYVDRVRYRLLPGVW